ncbi:hypothetical protein O181_068559 [Austropuccinia psidii MF-1]|uniref:Uncharacterized protein n=1 Tax=Austropuccinia psidii MF-1 TaxID=1389203 RepID=A0A9Q3EXI8_9BASI|nr:hypothetical protein [Austropuccinia psidii MF-1]
MANNIHLAAQDGLNVLGGTLQPTTPESAETFRPMDISHLVNEHDRITVNSSSILQQSAHLASYLHQSLKRCEKFTTTLKLVYDEAIPTNDFNLLSHVVTQWNSTYDMFKCAFSLTEAYDQF